MDFYKYPWSNGTDGVDLCQPTPRPSDPSIPERQSDVRPTIPSSNYSLDPDQDLDPAQSFGLKS